jgi:DNA-binding CsgD family transcriptional regulator
MLRSQFMRLLTLPAPGRSGIMHLHYGVAAHRHQALQILGRCGSISRTRIYRGAWGRADTRGARLESDEFNHVVDALYDAAVEPGSWMAAIAALCRYIGASATHFITWDSQKSAIRLNELFARIERAVSARYKAAPLFRGPRRPEPRTVRQEKTALKDSLDRLALGVVVIDNAAKILVANAAAEDVLRRGEGLRSARGRLVAVRPEDDRELQRIIAASQSVRGETDRLGDALPIARGEGRMPLFVLAAPLPPRAAWQLGRGGRAVLLLVSDPEAKPKMPGDVLARLFGLTKAEARVATTLASGKSLEAIAEEFGVSKNTIRVQLQMILSKTGTARQAELVRLLLSLPSTR